jgi:uncharacterized membrane protein
MNTDFFNIIKQIISEQGEEIFEEPSRLKSLISDCAKNKFKAEQFAFGCCIEYGAYGKLKQAASPDERKRVKAELVRRLYDEKGLDKTLCAEMLDTLDAALEAATEQAVANDPPAAEAAHTSHTMYAGEIQTNAMLRKLARSQLKGSWLPMIGISVIYVVFVLCVSFIINFFTVLASSRMDYYDFVKISVGNYIANALVCILCSPLVFGLYDCFLKKARGGAVRIDSLFTGFNMVGKAFSLSFYNFLFLTGWFLLLIIPGCIKVISYSMAYFIMLDNPRMSSTEAITASRNMMNGYKAKFFFLNLSFLGWFLLCILSLGIGFIWLFPYITLANTNLYEELKKNYAQREADKTLTRALS